MSKFIELYIYIYKKIALLMPKEKKKKDHDRLEHLQRNFHFPFFQNAISL